jgi:predicted component of type VI protein secretion system
MNESVIPAEDVDPSVEEALAVHAWRAEQLRRLGVPEILAETFADDVDWHTLSALIERGCPLGLAFEIIR